MKARSWSVFICAVHAKLSYSFWFLSVFRRSLLTAPARTKIPKLESNGEHLQIKQPTSGFFLWKSKVLWKPLNALVYRLLWSLRKTSELPIWPGIYQSFIFVMDKTDSGKRLCYLHVSTVAFRFLIFLLWLARSSMTGERQTKSKNCKRAPCGHSK